MQVRLCCLRRTLCCLQRPKGYVLGWCLGNNPPFVFCGIRLIGLPALSGRDLISACLPFPLAGRPFHRSHPAHSTLQMPHRQVRVDVSFLLRSQGSRLPRRVQFYTWAEFPQTFHVLRVRQPHTNSPAHLAKSVSKEIRISTNIRGIGWFLVPVSMRNHAKIICKEALDGHDHNAI